MGKTDLEFMLDPDLWPRWPYLPLKKRNPTGVFPLHGTLVTKGKGRFEFIQVDVGSHIRRGGSELVQKLFHEGWVVE